MAQLKDSLITGDLRVTGKIYGLGTGLTNIDASQITSGTLPVGRGGTGATTFTSGALLIGNGTNAVTTRTIKNMTAKGNLGWTAAATDIYIPTVNTLAYWNGRYNDSNSNLEYCVKGAFGNAATYGVKDATANGALGTGTSLTTERAVYYGLVTVNNASQTRATGIYAPTSGGTANQILVSAGSTSAPTWKATANGAAYATSANGALTFGTLPLAQGGTGKTTLTTAREQFNTPEFIVGTWTAASSAWTGVTTDSALYEGKQIILYMPFASTSTAVTLNLTLSGGGTTGAKNVYFQSTTRMTTHYGAYSQVHLIYHAALNINGTNYEGWWSLPGRDTNDNYLATPYYYRPKTYTALYRYQVCLTKNETYILPINAVSNTTGTTKTLTTEEFDPFGPIFYYNNTNTVNADAYVPDGRLPQNMWVDLRYSFNTGQTLTANKAVYIVAEPQSNGMAKLYSTPITQTLPTASDGRIYILLGVAYNNQNIQMTPNHPVYYYAGNGIKLWTGIAGYTIWYDSSTQILHFDTIDNNDASSLSQAVAQLQSLHGVNLSTGTYKTVAQEISENKTITETTDFNISGNQFNMVVNS